MSLDDRPQDKTDPTGAPLPEHIENPTDAGSTPAASRPEFPRDSTPGKIVTALHTVYDPEIPVDIFELG